MCIISILSFFSHLILSSSDPYWMLDKCQEREKEKKKEKNEGSEGVREGEIH